MTDDQIMAVATAISGSASDDPYRLAVAAIAALEEAAPAEDE